MGGIFQLDNLKGTPIAVSSVHCASRCEIQQGKNFQTRRKRQHWFICTWIRAFAPPPPPRLMVPVSNSGLEPAVHNLESGQARRRPGPVLSINLVRHTFKGKVSEISPHTCRRMIYKEQWRIDVAFASHRPGVHPIYIYVTSAFH